MNLLFPRLNDRECREIVGTWATEAPSWSVRHQQQTFGPLGGQRVTDERLERLRSVVLDLTLANARAQSDRSSSDALVALALRREMPITCHEASQPEVWQFLSCVLLPDVLVWRFGREVGVVEERWRGTGKRNTFGRLWWRAEVLEERDRPPAVLHRLREDELVAIMERPSLSGNPGLARCIAGTFIETIREPDALAKAALAGRNGRQTIMRELTKRLLRVGSVRSFDVMEPEGIKDLVRDQMHITCRSLAPQE